MKSLLAVAVCLASLVACGRHDLGSASARCVATDRCTPDRPRLLDQFRAGTAGCRAARPTRIARSIRVRRAGDGSSYCFRICLDEARVQREPRSENESNCSASITFIDGARRAAGCIPPAERSSGEIARTPSGKPSSHAALRDEAVAPAASAPRSSSGGRLEQVIGEVMPRSLPGSSRRHRRTPASGRPSGSGRSLRRPWRAARRRARAGNLSRLPSAHVPRRPG
jgi:hypothetical protein